MARGLYGPLVVYDHGTNQNGVGSDIVILADDWLLNSDDQIDANSFGNLGHWSHGGRLGNALSINCKFKPAIRVSPNSAVRLGFLNAANARILNFELSRGAMMKEIYFDGSPCDSFDTNWITFGPGQRVDVLIKDASPLVELLEASSAK